MIISMQIGRYDVQYITYILTTDLCSYMSINFSLQYVDIEFIVHF